MTHYWKQRLCRVQNSLPSVKNRALGKDLLCRVLHSAKSSLPSAGHSANTDTRQRTSLPSTRLSAKSLHSAKAARETAFGHGLLCRAPAIRHSAKICFFKKKILCRVPQIWHSAKINFFLKFFAERLRSGARQRIFLKKELSLPSA